MSDLISRKELLKYFCINKNGQRIPEVDCDNIEVTVSIKDVKRIIREQPTAFDTEKVVEEVKKLDLDGVSMVEDGKYTLVRRNEVISLIQTNGVCNGRQKSCKYCYKKDCPLSTEKTLSDKWSDIVKKGGVE